MSWLRRGSRIYTFLSHALIAGDTNLSIQVLFCHSTYTVCTETMYW